MKDNQVQDHSKKGVTAGERLLSTGLLAVMALIAGVMLLVQGRYDPSAWRQQARSAENASAIREPALEAADKASGLDPLSITEHYTSDTLSDKIDGKADLYLSAGFRWLASRRFSLAGDKGRWMERFVYDMGAFRNAYAVFSAQRRPNAQPVELAAHAYLAGNGLFFVYGPFYVEIIAAEASPEVQKGMNVLAEAFVASQPVQAEELAELRLFPPDHLVAGSVKLAARDAFGIQGLDGIFTAAYALDKAQALVFVSRQVSPDEARALAEKFHAFWLEFGGEAVAPPADLQGAGIVSILDNYEISMARGDYLIGVHEAANLEFGLGLLKQVERAIAEVAR